jgi:hypothetical protein
MSPDLADLNITEPEIERLTGFDVGPIFIGGVFGGVWRSSVWHHPQRLFLLGLTECLVAGLVYVFSLPLGLAMLQPASPSADQNMLFFVVTLGVTLAVMVGWNVYMQWRSQRLRTLMHLLDEVDRYHEVVQAVHVLDQLVSVGHAPDRLPDRADILQALQITRSNLIAGLVTEKILRTHRNLLSRRDEFLQTIEQNLASLNALEVNNQGQEYRELLHQTLQISLNVQQEMLR